MRFRTVDDYMAWVQHTIDDRLRVLETSLLVSEQIDVDDLEALMADQARGDGPLVRRASHPVSGVAGDGLAEWRDSLTYGPVRHSERNSSDGSSRLWLYPSDGAISSVSAQKATFLTP
jgi:hypothetical protein